MTIYKTTIIQWTMNSYDIFLQIFRNILIYFLIYLLSHPPFELVHIILHHYQLLIFLFLLLLSTPYHSEILTFHYKPIIHSFHRLQNSLYHIFHFLSLFLLFLFLPGLVSYLNLTFIPPFPTQLHKLLQINHPFLNYVSIGFHELFITNIFNILTNLLNQILNRLQISKFIDHLYVQIYCSRWHFHISILFVHPGPLFIDFLNILFLVHQFQQLPYLIILNTPNHYFQLFLTNLLEIIHQHLIHIHFTQPLNKPIQLLPYFLITP